MASRFSDEPSQSAEVYASLPGKQVAAACLSVDDDGRVLLVKPTYKEPWELPGGVVEAGESPWHGCRREILEELGLDIRPGRLLAVDHRAAHDGIRPDALRFVFDGGRLNPAETPPTLPDEELSEWRFVDPDRLDDYVIPVMARRIRACLSGHEGAAYLEEGAPPAGPPPRIDG